MAGAVQSAAKPRERSGKMQPQERHLRARDRLRSRDRLKGQPQEGQHSADAKRRDPGPTAPGERYNMKREVWKPKGGDARSCAGLVVPVLTVGRRHLMMLAARIAFRYRHHQFFDFVLEILIRENECAHGTACVATARCYRLVGSGFERI